MENDWEGPGDNDTLTLIPRVSDTGVRYVIENSSGAQLRELNLTNLTKIGDVTLLRIAQTYVQCHIYVRSHLYHNHSPSFSCKSLTCLSFCYCEHISDTGVELLGHIPSLTSLDLSGCSIQDEGIRGLRSNPQFKFLMLAELLDITDDGLQVSIIIVIIIIVVIIRIIFRKCRLICPTWTLWI